MRWGLTTIYTWAVSLICTCTRIELAYNTPHLEYASIVWSPWQSYLEYALEKVQHQAAQYVCNKYGISITNLTNDLKWVMLCIMYKIHHGFVNIPLNEYSYLTINNNPYQK